MNGEMAVTQTAFPELFGPEKNMPSFYAIIKR
jgi:hypothetical protein